GAASRVYRTLTQMRPQVLGTDLNRSEFRGALPTLCAAPNDSTQRAGRPLHCRISIRCLSALGHSRPKRSKLQARACPLYPRKRTLSDTTGMSALPPQADIERHDWHVRFTPASGH